jgi:transcriptional regulator with XRE-family HTH domain
MMANNEPMARRAPDSEVDAIAMGGRVRSIRQTLGLSSAELALRAGLSAGVISQIERGQANPSLRTLERLRLALDVPLMVLLEGPGSAGAEPAFVRRRHARPRLMVGNKGLAKDILSPPNTDGLRFMVITMPPGAQSEDVLTGPGQKAGLVLKGQISLTVRDEQVQIAEGDSFQFPSDVEHGFVNNTDQPAEVLWIMVGPSHVTPV